MQIDFQLALEQSLQMKITPAFKVSIDILQIASHDLAGYLWDMSTDNPVLEVEFTEDLPQPRLIRKSAAAPDVDLLVNLPSNGSGMYDVLLEQLRLLNLPRDVFRAAAFLVGNLDESGYLTLPPEEAARFLQLPQPVCEQALDALQSLEPSGIGARNLQDCLRLQIARDPEAPDCAAQIVQSHLRDLGTGKFGKIAEALQLDIAAINEAFAYIRTLNPRPGAALSSAERPFVVPDAEIVREGGRYVVRMMDHHLPRLQLNPVYCGWLHSYPSPSVGSYIRQQLKSAKMIIRSVERRKSTLQAVIAAIFEQQQRFLEVGVSGLQPIDLKAIAAHTGFHPSTVSRSVQNKYISTPHGLYALGYFFSRKVETATGRTVSSKSIQSLIKELIDQENKQRPLSDQQIVHLLKKRGIKIARRTVAKYREESGILSSGYRRQF